MKKNKFKPQVTRVKLNPEQAVLVCDCYINGWAFYPSTSDLRGPLSLNGSQLPGAVACVFTSKNNVSMFGVTGSPGGSGTFYLSSSSSKS